MRDKVRYMFLDYPVGTYYSKTRLIVPDDSDVATMIVIENPLYIRSEGKLAGCENCDCTFAIDCPVGEDEMLLCTAIHFEGRFHNPIFKRL